MATWSNNFKVLKDNFKDIPIDRTIRTSMDVGPAKVRRRTMLVTRNISFSMLLTDKVYEEFRQFYYDNDSLLFDFPEPDTKEMVQARFLSVYTGAVSDNLWSVSVSLEILP